MTVALRTTGRDKSDAAAGAYSHGKAF